MFYKLIFSYRYLSHSVYFFGNQLFWCNILYAKLYQIFTPTISWKMKTTFPLHFCLSRFSSGEMEESLILTLAVVVSTLGFIFFQYHFKYRVLCVIAFIFGLKRVLPFFMCISTLTHVTKMSKSRSCENLHSSCVKLFVTTPCVIALRSGD